VWRITPAARTYISSNNLQNIGVFCTYGGSPGKIYENAAELSRGPVARLGIKKKELENSDDDVRDFCRKIKNHLE
jgi:hypothetical protein